MGSIFLSVVYRNCSLEGVRVIIYIGDWICKKCKSFLCGIDLGRRKVVGFKGLWKVDEVWYCERIGKIIGEG